MSLAPQCGAAGTAASRYLRPSPGLNVAKQPDFSIRHRTLLRYRSFTYEGATIRHVTLFSHAPSRTRIDIEPRHPYEVIAPFVLDTSPIPSSIRAVRVYVIESMSNFFGCVVCRLPLLTHAQAVFQFES